MGVIQRVMAAAEERSPDERPSKPIEPPGMPELKNFYGTCGPKDRDGDSYRRDLGEDPPGKNDPEELVENGRSIEAEPSIGCIHQVLGCQAQGNHEKSYTKM